MSILILIMSLMFYNRMSFSKSIQSRGTALYFQDFSGGRVVQAKYNAKGLQYHKDDWLGILIFLILMSLTDLVAFDLGIFIHT